MSTKYHQHAHEPDSEGFTVSVSPQSANWRFASLNILELEANQTTTFDTGQSEWIVLPLAGSCVVRCAKDTFELEGRESVFSRVTDFAYVPRDATITIHSAAGGRFALTGAVARRTLPARYGAADAVPIELRGTGSASRQATNFASPQGFETDRLIAVEVLTPGGNWSSYPPHKHDEDRPGEAVLEEIYYFEVNGGVAGGAPGPGGYQRVYASGDPREIDILAEVRTGDTILIPFGYHGPTMAAPGYDLYFLNVLAGDAEPRTMAFCDDPTHAWVRDSWKLEQVDPRLPLTTHRGAR